MTIKLLLTNNKLQRTLSRGLKTLFPGIMYSDYEIPNVIAMVIHTLALIALIISLWKLFSSKDKSYSFYIVSILHIAYAGYPIMKFISIFWIHFEGWINPPPFSIGGVAIIIYVFSIHWTAANALFTYLLSRSVVLVKPFDLKGFMTKALITSCFVAFSFPFM